MCRQGMVPLPEQLLPTQRQVRSRAGKASSGFPLTPIFHFIVFSSGRYPLLDPLSSPRTRAELSFIQSEFRGLLPKPFAPIDGTRVIPSAMNHMNREEPSRYVCVIMWNRIIPAGALKNHKRRHPNIAYSSFSPCTICRYPWTRAITLWTLSPRQQLRWSPILPLPGGRCGAHNRHYIIRHLSFRSFPLPPTC